MKTLLALLSIVFSTAACAAQYDTTPLENQAHKIEEEINRGNRIYARVKHTLSSNDIETIGSTSSLEVSAEYELDAVTAFLQTMNRAGGTSFGAKNKAQIQTFKKSLGSICEMLKIRLLAATDEIQNKELKDEMNIQLLNIRAACDMAGGMIINHDNVNDSIIIY